MERDETIEFANELESAFEGSDQEIAMSAIFQGDSVGFPLRIADPEQDNFDEEPAGFDEAYEFATELLDADHPTVETVGGYVWFKKESEA